MLEDIKKIPSIRGIVSDESYLFVLSENSLRCLDKFDFKELWLSDISKIDFSTMRIHGEKIILRGLHGEIYLVDKKNGKIKTLNIEKCYIKNDTSSDVLLSSIYYGDRSKLSRIKIEDDVEVIWQLDYEVILPHFQCNNSLYIVDRNRKGVLIKISDIKTGKVSWELDLSDFGKFIDRKGRDKKGEIKAIVGEFKERVIVWLTDKKIAVINSNNGQLLWIKDKFDNEANDRIDGNNLPYLYNLIILPEKGVAVNLIGDCYFKVNLESDNIEFIKHVRDDYNGYQLFVKPNIVVLNEFILFNSQKDDSSKVCLIGLFDIKEQRVILIKEIDLQPKAFLHREAQFDSDYIYLIDSENDLHILRNNATQQ